MRPKTNFDEWSEEFKLALESKSKFTSYFADCQELIEEYLQSQTLSEPNQSQTDHFISKLIPSYTKKILKLRKLSSDDLQLTMTFLSKILAVYVYQFIQGDFEKYEIIMNIFDSDLKLYTKPAEKQFNKLCELFLQDGNFDKLINRLSSNDPELIHLTLLLELRTTINPYAPIPIEKVLEASYHFIVHFKDENSLRKIETSELQKSLEENVFDQMPLEPNADYTYIFQFGLYMLKCQILEKQLLGVDMLVGVINNLEKTDPRLANWIITTDLINYICTAHVHVEVIKRITPLFKYLSRQNKIDNAIIERLLSKISIIHQSEQESMYNLIFASMKGFSDESILEFINSHELDNAFISLLMENSNSIDVKQLCVNILLKRQSTKDLLAGLSKVTRSFVIKYIQDSSSEISSKYLDELLPKLIETSRNPKAEFEMMIQKIVENGSNDEQNQDKIFSILKTYISKLYNENIQLDIVKNLFNVQNDKLWLLFTDLLTDKGSYLFDIETYQYIDQFFNNYDYSSVDSIDFIKFLYTYSLRSMENKNELVSYYDDYDEFVFSDFPQSFLPFFEKAYFSLKCHDDSELFHTVQNYLLDFYLKFDDFPIEKFAIEINDHYISRLTVGDLTLSRTISFLVNLIKKLEDGFCLEDFGLPRHEDELKDTSIVTLHFDDQIRQIHFETENQFLKLYKRIKTFTENNVYAKLKLLSKDVEVEKHDFVYKYENDLTFEVKDYGEILNREMLSIELHQKYHLTEKAYDLFKHLSELDQTTINLNWSLIQLLPSLNNLNVDISHCENEYILRYSLEMISLDKKFNNYSSLIDLLVSRKLKNSDIFIMNVILSIFNDEFIQYFPKIAKIILDQFPIGKDLEIPAKLLRKMSKKFENRSDILHQYVDEIVTMLFTVIKPTIRYITQTILSINNIKPIVDKAIEQLDSVKNQENIDYIIKVLLELYRQHHSELNDQEFINSIINIGDSINITILLNAFESFLENDTQQKGLIKNYMFDTLLNRIVKEDQIDSLALYLSFLTYFEDLEVPIKKLIENTKINEFNIKQAKQTHSIKNPYKHNAFCGIKNMGVTCFMNSILQQLFYTFPFRYLVMKTEQDSLLFNIFSDLMNENNDVISMKKYVKEVNKIIDTDEQQDAYEFFQLLIDKQNQECQAIFTGNFVNHIEGINNDYNSVNTENFTALDMTVNNKENLDESFHTFAESEYFSIQDKIDVKRYQKIGKAPPVLVIQLKRFEMDYNTFTRYKINSVYKFPQEIDLGPYMDDAQIEHKYYELFGIVIHSGQANAGHYYSLIKLNNKWYEFNDTTVFEFDESKLQRVAFGARNSMKNGYLLFYHEKEAVFDDNGISIKYDELPDHSLFVNAAKTNYNCLFNDALFEFVLTASPEFQIEYLFNIFIHSSADFLSCNRLFESLDEKIGNAVDFFYQTAANEIDSIIQMILNCETKEIPETVLNLIKIYIDNESSNTFFNALLSHLSIFLVNYKKLPSIASLLKDYASSDTKSTKQQFAEAILKFISEFYKSSTEKMQTEIDFSDFFEILKILNVTDLSAIEPYFDKIIQSKKNSSIIQILNKEQKRKLLSLFDNASNYVHFVIQSAASDVSNTSLFKELIFENSPSNIEKSSIILSILEEINQTTTSSPLIQMFLNEYSELICPYFFNSDPKIRLNAEKITLELFPSVKPLNCEITSPNVAIWPLNSNTATAAMKKFSKSLPSLIQKSLPLIENNYKTISISNFLNIIVWISKRCGIDTIQDLNPIFTLCLQKNGDNTIDNNLRYYMKSISHLLKGLYRDDTIPERYNVFPLLKKLCQDKDDKELISSFFDILNLLNEPNLSDFYGTHDFINFFNSQIESKVDDEEFENTFQASFVRVITFSDEIANKFIDLFKSESKFEENVQPISFLVKTRPDLIQVDFYRPLIQYSINCANNNADFELFKDILMAINPIFDQQINKGLDLSSIDKNEIASSLPYLNGKSSLTKRYYGVLLTNFASADKSWAEFIINELLKQFAIQKDQVESEKELKYFVITLLNCISKSKLFTYFTNQFLNDILPSLSTSLCAKFEIFDFLEANIKDLIDEACVVMTKVLLTGKIRYGNNDYQFTNYFAKVFAQNVPIEKIHEMIAAVENQTPAFVKNVNELNEIFSSSLSSSSSDFDSSS